MLEVNQLMALFLTGVWDGDINNEVTFPNGTILPDPESITEDVLFNYGQSCK